MTTARSLANRKLYHAAVLQRILASEIEREDIPRTVLLEAVGDAVRLQLLQAYGWFLLELAEVSELPDSPPTAIAELIQNCDLTEPLRGELVELQGLEGVPGWLSDMQAPRAMQATGVVQAAGNLAVTESGWSLQQLQVWQRSLTDLIDRMSHSLEEW